MPFGKGGIQARLLAVEEGPERGGDAQGICGWNKYDEQKAW